ncbi:MAG: ribosome silencing factor [Deltaproteobacteria bacterium]
MAKKNIKTVTGKMALLFANAALEKKAKDMAIVYVGDTSSVTDYFIVCTGTSDRHVVALCDAIQLDAKKAGFLPIGVEGKDYGNWTLLDYGDVVIHIFLDSVRKFYEIERLWMDVPKMLVPEDVYKITKISLDNND